MFTPFTHLATALTLIVSSQLPIAPISLGWVSEPASHRCSAVSHDHWGNRPAAAKRSAATGRPASQVQIVTFGP